MTHSQSTPSEPWSPSSTRKPRRQSQRRAGFNALAWIGALACLLIGLASDAEIMTALGLGVVGYTFFAYVSALGDDIAIVQLAAFVAAAQWILGPFFEYAYGDAFSPYAMSVPEADYMAFATPSVIAMVVVLTLLTPRIGIGWLHDEIRSRKRLSQNVVYLVILGGFLADLVGGSVPASLRFVVFLVSQFKFVGAIYLLIIDHRLRWPILGAVFFAALASSAAAGLFHNVILWSALVLTFVCHDLRLGTLVKLSIISAGVVALIGLQSAKAAYREAIALNPNDAGVELLFDAVAEALSGSDTGVVYEQSDSTLIVRLNQGWIISAVMAHVPQGHPHENGATIVDAVQDSLLPRFLTTKSNVEVSNAFRQYTGRWVNRNTSFGISILGEAWVNFGQMGWLMMAGWGAVFGLMIRYVAVRSIEQPSFALWTPLIVLQAVKAETELVVALNHMAKAGLFVILIYFIAHRLLKIRL